MTTTDVVHAVSLQALAFPPPFPQDLLWRSEHLLRHLGLFPQGQLVAVCANEIIGSCSNTIVEEAVWQAHGSWFDTVGGPMLTTFAPQGSTLYGLDITVHPGFRRVGVGRGFYEARFELVRTGRLRRFGTACRLPDYCGRRDLAVEEYVQRVLSGKLFDRTLTPLLRYGLDLKGVIQNYMEDQESGNAAALLEWNP